ncbi:MAG TPA: transcriptional regulator [Blastocatellia bacterium]|nr:transcriptional regulator [Blastocatellia bacterium]
MAKRNVLRTENIAEEDEAVSAPQALASVTNASAKAAETTELDRLIHERTRLAIISALAVNETMTFNDLKALLNTTDGNLSVHARKLEEAEYIVCTKSFEGRIPKTEYQVTAAGRKALERYLNHMEALIQATRRK